MMNKLDWIRSLDGTTENGVWCHVDDLSSDKRYPECVSLVLVTGYRDTCHYNFKTLFSHPWRYATPATPEELRAIFKL